MSCFDTFSILAVKVDHELDKMLEQYISSMSLNNSQNSQLKLIQLLEIGNEVIDIADSIIPLTQNTGVSRVLKVNFTFK